MLPRELSPAVMATEQVIPADLPSLKDAGVTLIVNNRPDGESPDQPDGAEIAVAAKSLGIAYAAIPITPAGLQPEQVRALSELLEQHDGKTLLYCRSGTRSTFLWALSRASAGEPVDRIVAAAERAGYSLAPIRQALDSLAAQSPG